MDVSDIFCFFSARGSPRCREGRGGTAFHGKSPEGGGPPQAGGGSSGREGACGEFGGEGAKYFFFGAEIPGKVMTCFPILAILNLKVTSILWRFVGLSIRCHLLPDREVAATRKRDTIGETQSPIFSGGSPLFYNRRVPPCAVKTCAVRPVFAPVVGELWAPDPSKCPRAHEAKC